MVKIWRMTGAKSEYTIAHIINMEELVESDAKYLLSVPLQGNFPRLQLDIKTRHAPDDFFETGGLLIVSNRLKTLLGDFRVNAEYFELDIRYKGVPYNECDYFFANLLDKVDCLDTEKSRYTVETGRKATCYHVEKLVVDERKAAGYDLFRLDRTAQVVVCASDELAERVNASGLTGMDLVPPSKLHEY